MRPGHTAGDVFDAHARVIDEHGMEGHRLNACGYSLGAKFTPSWMDARCSTTAIRSSFNPEWCCSPI